MLDCRERSVVFAQPAGFDHRAFIWIRHLVPRTDPETKTKSGTYWFTWYLRECPEFRWVLRLNRKAARSAGRGRFGRGGPGYRGIPTGSRFPADEKSWRSDRMACRPR